MSSSVYELFNMNRKNGLFFVKDKELTPPAIRFILEEAEKLKVTAVFVRFLHESNPIPIPQVYVYDNTTNMFNLNGVAEKVWCFGKVPITLIFDNKQVLIYNNLRTPELRENQVTLKPVETISLASKVEQELKAKRFSAHLLANGSFWHEDKNKELKYGEGSYELLLKCFSAIRGDLIKEISGKINNPVPPIAIYTIDRVIMLCVLVKYLEERRGEYSDCVFQNGFFAQFNNAETFIEVVRSASALNTLFAFLSQKFVGEIFRLGKCESDYLELIDLNHLADFLEGKLDGEQYCLFKLYSFNELPIELISNIYEELMVDKVESRIDGVVYTPPHLVQFIIDEAMPLNTPPDNIFSFKILDPSCGSGIFLVCAYKRIVQWWIIKNNWARPSQEILVALLRACIFGVDKSPTATQVAAFSLFLAVCDFLAPKEIWGNLKFDNFDKDNLKSLDFFDYNPNELFDLIVGNPPFNRYKQKQWTPSARTRDDEFSKKHIHRPSSPNLAYLFFEEGYQHLKPKGRICLILPANGLLYIEASLEYRKFIFEHHNILQIIDFTYLNRSLFNGESGDISVCVLFGEKTSTFADYVLHLIVKNTLPAKEKLFFEIDYYDFFYINRQEIFTDKYVFKSNYWGGGRLSTIIDNLSQKRTFADFIEELPGFHMSGGKREDSFLREVNDKNRYLNLKGMYRLDTQNKSFTTNEIILDHLNLIPEDTYIAKESAKPFLAPHILIRRTVEKKSSRVPIDYLPDTNMVFGERVIGIHGPESSIATLEQIYNKFKASHEALSLFLAVTSSDYSTGTATGILNEDIDKLPWGAPEENIKLTSIGKIYYNDIFSYILDFKTRGEKSKALARTDNDDVTSYTSCFCKILNNIYTSNRKQFNFVDKTAFDDNNFLMVTFKYSSDSFTNATNHHWDESQISSMMTSCDEGKSYVVKRIVRYYEDDTIVFIKPNEKRFWLQSIAIRDADDAISNFLEEGR